MGWPKGKSRKQNPEARNVVPVAESQALAPEASDAEVAPSQGGISPDIPEYWRHGALLNVRNAGDAYLLTLWPEEYDYRKPERGLRFTNPGECQDFVSRWYSRQNHDPRAI